MSEVELEVIRNCFEGATPAILATVDRQGMPNVSLISHAYYLDAGRVALSYQFFNKARRNLLATGTASVEIVDLVTCARYRLALVYEGTETAGPLFDVMKARLVGIASHASMQGVFRLLGADVVRVRAAEAVPGPVFPAPPAQRNLLGAARRIVADLGAAPGGDLGALVDRALDAFGRYLGIGHAMVLTLEASEGRLYTGASRGYPVSGIGSEIPLGPGVIGVAAREAVPSPIHRSAGHLLVRGAEPGRLMAEIMGREGGYGRGRSGPLHVWSGGSAWCSPRPPRRRARPRPGVALSRKVPGKGGIAERVGPQLLLHVGGEAIYALAKVDRLGRNKRADATGGKPGRCWSMTRRGA